MGLEILEEFRPITPIITVPAARTFSQRCSRPDKTKKPLPILSNDNFDQESHTPRSPPHSLMKSEPFVCPPTPKKPRLVLTKRNLVSPPPQGFFKVPDDLASVFKPYYKIRAASVI